VSKDLPWASICAEGLRLGKGVRRSWCYTTKTMFDLEYGQLMDEYHSYC
jgi:hypothetical protein